MAARVYTDWPYKVDRSHWVAVIEVSMQLARIPAGYSAKQLEELIFLSALTREKYLEMMGELFKSIKEYIVDSFVGTPPGTEDNQDDIQHLQNVLQNLRLSGGQQDQPPQQGDERS